MAINYSPIIDGQIQAFYLNTESGSNYYKINIKYRNNPLFSIPADNIIDDTTVETDVKMVLRIFSPTGREITKSPVESTDYINAKTTEVLFKISQLPQPPGLDEIKRNFTKLCFYKFQIAYKFITKTTTITTDTTTTTEEIGPYTSLATLKFTYKPKIKGDGIYGLELSYDSLLKKYVVTYTPEDKTEIISKFQLITGAEGSSDIEQTEWLDFSIGGQTVYYGNKDFTKIDEVDITVNIKTVNGLEESIVFEDISTKKTFTDTTITNFSFVCNTEYGINNIFLINKNIDSSSITEIEKIYRKDYLGNWNEIFSGNIIINDSDILPQLIYEDSTIDLGVKYEYSFQIKTNKSETKLLNKPEDFVINECPYTVLSDKDRILPLKLNSDISSFKNTLQEQKIDTIGGKYPLFFRNGTLSYKEFSLTGLITYWLDEEKRFYEVSSLDYEEAKRQNTESNETTINNTKTTQLTSFNYANEREFKLEVLNWLNNGKPKILRTPQEGRYIVRLMNVSLSPEKTTARMLHTFSATAYEIADFNYDNLKSNNLIS